MELEERLEKTMLKGRRQDAVLALMQLGVECQQKHMPREKIKEYMTAIVEHALKCLELED